MPVGKAQAEASGGYDNSSPRTQQNNLSDWGARAVAAHQNQIESFPLFAAGILVAVVSGVDPTTAGYLGVAYLISRLIFIYAYVKDIATFRSMVWIVGFGCTLALLCSPAWSG